MILINTTQFLYNITYIFTYFFTHTYFQRIQTTLPNDLNFTKVYIYIFFGKKYYWKITIITFYYYWRLSILQNYQSFFFLRGEVLLKNGNNYIWLLLIWLLLKTSNSAKVSAMSFPVTKVFCLLKNWVVWKKEHRNFKYVDESKRVKNIRPDYLCIMLNLIDDWLKLVSQTRNAAIQIIAIFVDWIL